MKGSGEGYIEGSKFLDGTVAIDERTGKGMAVWFSSRYLSEHGEIREQSMFILC